MWELRAGLVSVVGIIDLHQRRLYPLYRHSTLLRTFAHVFGAFDAEIPVPFGPGIAVIGAPAS